MNIPLSNPDITLLERQAVMSVLQTSSLSLGPKLPEFEKSITRYVGTKYAVAVNSGTSALHLIVRALGIGPGDEVITTPFSFVSSANCILYERAKPVFVDIEPDTLNIDPDLIEAKINRKTKAILAVDVFGHPAQWGALQRIARKYRLKLIEDSCEALGAEWRKKKAGVFADAAAFAFYPNKQMTTGEGGVIVTNNRVLADLCVSMRNQGRSKGGQWLQHERLGYNYRLSDINCALGIAQMKRLGEILRKRAIVASQYNELLQDIEEIEVPFVAPDVEISWFVYVIRLKEEYGIMHRDRILQFLKKSGISCSNYFSPPIHLQPFYRQTFGYKRGAFPVTESISDRTIALPFYSNLKKQQIIAVARMLRKGIRAVQ